MTTHDFIIALFYAVDQEMLDVRNTLRPNSIRVKSSPWPCCLP